MSIQTWEIIINSGEREIKWQKCHSVFFCWIESQLVQRKWDTTEFSRCYEIDNDSMMTHWGSKYSDSEKALKSKKYLLTVAHLHKSVYKEFFSQNFS